LVFANSTYQRLSAFFFPAALTTAELIWTRMWVTIKKEVQRFIAAFTRKPLLIKLPRELGVFVPSAEWFEFLHILKETNADGMRVGIIAANSQRCRVAPMFHENTHRGDFFGELAEGVLCGPALFFDTYDLIRRICQPGTAWKEVPIVASGGITTVQTILDIREFRLCSGSRSPDATIGECKIVNCTDRFWGFFVTVVSPFEFPTDEPVRSNSSPEFLTLREGGPCAAR
jgi:hypothetical protein